MAGFRKLAKGAHDLGGSLADVLNNGITSASTETENFWPVESQR